MSRGLCVGVAAFAAAVLIVMTLLWLRPAPAMRTARDAGQSVPVRIPLAPLRVPVLPASLAFEKVAAEENLEERNRGLDALLRDWAGQDASGAAGFVLTVEDESLRRECVLRVMESWGGRDAAAALAWAEKAGFESAYEREIMMSAICTTAAGRDPRAAVELGAAHGLGDFVNGVMGALVERWAETDLIAASSWTATQEPGVRRDALVETIALVVFDTDPVEATRWLFAQTAAGEGRERIVSTLMSRLATQDPDLAREWAVSSFPAGPSRDRALEQIEQMRSWPGDKG